MNSFSKIKTLRDSAGNNYWQNRICTELYYAYALNKAASLGFDKKLSKVADKLFDIYNAQGSITKDVALKTEGELSFIADEAKKMTAHLVAHAHIDMNWMWGYQETSAVVLDTFRTMLGFMEDYPEFTFSQSQASAYRIVEQFDTEMLEEIKKRVKEGRWEVTASTWVENDKNMSGFEAQVRQILYTKEYLSRLLDISPESLNMDFEPDTFGHSENVPTILASAGIKYYYHCRGFEDEQIYNWQAPSGEKLLVYREPKWYNADIEPYLLSDMPLMSCKYGVSDMLMVYGVGDHGGGPTRRDLNQIVDMMTWPIYPTMKFSSYHNFFEAIEPYRENFPTVDHELNYVFTGCYTTQSRLKRANKFAESRLYDSEMLTAGISNLIGYYPDKIAYNKAWVNTLFNQFHDILPGSCMNDPREYSLGLFQETLALSNSEEQKAVRKFISQIDTSDYVKSFDEDGGESEGGGAGYSISHVQGYMFSQAERGTGSTRICHVFNTTAYNREEAFDIVLFDYHFPLDLIEVVDANGNIVPCKVTENHQYYWKHIVTKVTIVAKVPAFGYSTYVVRQKEDDRDVNFSQVIIHRVHDIGDMPVVLENSLIRAEFNKTDMTLNSLINKRSGENLLRESSACFEYVRESNKRGESSWIVSEFMSLRNLNKEYDVKILESCLDPFNSYFKYRVEFGDSNIEATVSLRPESTMIDYDVWVNWVEPGTRATCIPQLRFSLNLFDEPDKYVYDVPMGFIERTPLAHDVPALSFQFAKEKGSGIVLASAEKYGFRGYNSKMSLDLLRSAFDPDPYPELGRHQIKFSFGVADNTDEAAKKAFTLCHPLISIPGVPGRKGKLKKENTFLSTDAEYVSAVKISEDESGVVIRIYNPSNKKKSVSYDLRDDFTKAFICDALENALKKINVKDGKIKVPVAARNYVTVKLVK